VDRAGASEPDPDDFGALSEELDSAVGAVNERIGEQLRKL